MSSIHINDELSITEGELREDFVRSSGPGGQNVNKVATAVQLRFDVSASTLPPEVKQRLLEIAGRRVDRQGFVRIEARRYRTQERNRKDARQRLVDLIARAAVSPKSRKRTHPTIPSQHRRLDRKHKVGQKKVLRARVSAEED